MKPTLIEFSNKTGYPFQIWERDEDNPGWYHSYDVEFSQSWNQLYASMSGGGEHTYLEGCDNKFWLADGEPLPVQYKTGTAEPAPAENRLTELPEKYRNSPDSWLEDDVCYHCEICNDWLPMNDGPCEHLWDCDECESVNWPGNECGHERIQP